MAYKFESKPCINCGNDVYPDVEVGIGVGILTHYSGSECEYCYEEDLAMEGADEELIVKIMEARADRTRKIESLKASNSHF